METIKKIWDCILRAGNNMAGLAVLLLSALITADVCGRTVFGSPIPGTTEIVKSSLAIMVFLALPETLRQKRFIRSTVVLNRLPKLGALTIYLLSSCLGLIIFVALCVESWDPAWTGWLTKEYEGIHLKVPVYPIRFLILVASGFVAIQFIINIINRFKEISSQLKGNQ